MGYTLVPAHPHSEPVSPQQRVVELELTKVAISKDQMIHYSPQGTSSLENNRGMHHYLHTRWELNLAVGVQIAIAKILADLNLVVQ